LFLSTILIKYIPAVGGYGILGIPVFTSKNVKYKKDNKNDTGAITKDFISGTNLMQNASKAIGRIILSYKDFQNLTGYTHLVNHLQSVLIDVSRENYTRTEVQKNRLNSYIGGEVNIIK
jgi:ATP-binding cassette subfamily D (ALD) protein 3